MTAADPIVTNDALRSWLRRTLVVVYLSLAIPATGLALALNTASLERVRQLLPGYPEWITVGAYMPLPPVVFFHQAGMWGLILMTAVFAAATLLLARSRTTLLWILGALGGAAHLAILLFVILSYSLCIFRIWRIMQVLT